MMEKEIIESNNTCQDKMNLQKYFPYDATIVGLDNIYYPVGKDAFYVNSSCIKAKDRIVIKNRTYVLVKNKSNHLNVKNSQLIIS